MYNVIYLYVYYYYLHYTGLKREYKRTDEAQVMATNCRTGLTLAFWTILWHFVEQRERVLCSH